MNIDDLKNNKANAPIPDQIAHLRKEVGRLEGENQKLREKAGSMELLAKVIEESIDSLKPLPAIPYKVSGKLESTAKMAAVVKFSDWHIGEVIRPEETEGFGKFNYAIAQERLNTITKKVIAWTHNHRMAFNIPQLYVFCEQDFISGDIHDELKATNEFPSPVQAVRAGKLLAQQIATFAPHFPEVHVIEVGGDNHSRLQKKPQAKQKATNSFGYVVYALANELLSQHKNVIIHEQDGMTHLANVVGQRFLCEHGDTIKAWMGIPYYGIERMRAREATRRMLERKKKDLGFDYVSCGHFHVPAVVSGNILMNGSLSGTSEFDHGCGRHARPSQVSFMVHPEHGIFDWTPWICDI
jgi:hypothetical protein